MIAITLLTVIVVLTVNCDSIDGNTELTSDQIVDQLQYHVFPKLAKVTLFNLPPSSSHLTLSTLLQRYNKARQSTEDIFNQDKSLIEKKRLSKKCLSHLAHITNGLTRQSDTNIANWTWLINLIDSYGKLGSGLLKGNIHWEGDYWQCLSVEVPKFNESDREGFKGRYCTAKWSLKLNSSSSVSSLQLSSGICVPNSCQQSDLTIGQSTANGLIKSLPFLSQLQSLVSLDEVYCPEHRQLGIDGVLCIIVVSIFVTSCLIATVIDLWALKDGDDDLNNKDVRTKSTGSQPSRAEEEVTHGSQVVKNDQVNCDEIVCEEGLSTVDGIGSKGVDKIALTQDDSVKSEEANQFDKVLQCFSFYANWCKLTNTESGKYELGAIHGIRFLSMVWIIAGHTYYFSLNVLRNVLEGLELIDNLPFYTILNGSLAVDSFFTLSGFLVSYLFFLAYNERKSFNVITFYIHRYWRLIPVYAMILWIYTSLGDNISSGPYWDYGDLEGSLFAICRRKWWNNLFFFNNLVDIQDQCLPYTWYLANDFQFYLVSPLFMLTLAWKKWLGLALCALTIVGSGIATFIINHQNNFPIYFGSHGALAASMRINQTQIMAEANDYMNKVYGKPFCRIGPYIIGIIAGYLLVQYIKHKYPIKKPWIKLGYLLAATLCLTSLYATYHSNMTRLQLAFHQSSFRVLWAIGVAMIIFICSTVKNSLVNRLLSYRLWVPLSRLTYSAYLVHPILLHIYYNNFKSSLEFSHVLMMSIFGAAILYVYLLALLASFLFEMPFLNLEKLFSRKKSKKV